MDPDELNKHLSDIETNWNVVRQAVAGSEKKRQSARAWLTERYGVPIRKYLRAAVHEDKRNVREEVVDELCQEFAVLMMDGKYVNKADPAEGRFRKYLKACLFRLVADHYRRKGKKEKALPDRFDVPDPAGKASEELDRAWRKRLIDRGLRDLEKEEQTHGGHLFTVLKYRMDHPEKHAPELAQMLTASLGKPVSAVWVRKQLQKARRRLCPLLLAHVAETLENPTLENILEEMAELELSTYCDGFLPKQGRDAS
jgi:hypothetical protein